ncbi:hypothetical protein, partial [Spirosoma utsteinense]|uniref:hypothetical protein n=1 Tax=Spirosoma utsteinense TaxID=2585773 RepID=UPI001C96E7C0
LVPIKPLQSVLLGSRRLLSSSVYRSPTLLSKPRQFVLLAVQISLFVLKAARIMPGTGKKYIE